MSTNAALFERAQRSIPGGVNSPVRAFRAVGGTPRFIKKALGAYIWDAEDQQYIDYIGSWGPMILGHGHPAVLDAVTRAAHDGLSFGAPCENFHLVDIVAVDSEILFALFADAVPLLQTVEFACGRVRLLGFESIKSTD